MNILSQVLFQTLFLETEPNMYLWFIFKRKCSQKQVTFYKVCLFYIIGNYYHIYPNINLILFVVHSVGWL